MPTVLRYAADQSVPLEVAPGALLADCGVPSEAALTDTAAALDRALNEPLEYPPLGSGMTPGDRVVLALDRGLPQAQELAAAAIAYLVRGGVALDGITVLQTHADAQSPCDDLRRHWPDAWRERVALLAHDPSDRGQMAYLATTSTGEPVMLNRALTDADVVLPVGCSRPPGSAGYFGIHSPLFPAFADRKAQWRFRSPEALRAGSKTRQRLAAEADEVGWLLGVAFTIQVVPAGGERLLDVLAGQPEAVRARGRQLHRAAWTGRVPRRASLVVAGIEGGPTQQTWQNLGRALAAAATVAEEGGAIALCCDLAGTPGIGMQCLAHHDSHEAALRRIRKDRPDDTLPAMQLAETLEDHRVYLLSRLEGELVEQLDMAPIGDREELIRLIRHHPSCIVLADAPHAAPTIEE
jgi:nickel-dependent lactate racemase